MGVDEFSASGVSLKDLSAAEFSRLSALFDESIEMAPGERDAWLAALEGSDPKTAALLRALCASQDDSRERGFLETSDLVASHVASLVEADPGLIGQRFGPYRVLALLGHGGMGSVWLAERADGLFTRQVALKLIHPALKSRVMSERFAREREILASLNHPHIARLLDAGFAEDGQSYLALDYVAGTPLTAYCDEHRLSVHERLELYRQVLSAVQYAHAHLVIHRDLKPANILVTAEGQVQLLDFGIAKLLSEGEAKETELTQMGGRALTPDYAAPEQIAGAPITTAADVYALGVMLYELLTGERPYKLKRDSRGALEEAILEADPVAPSRTEFKEATAAARATTAKKLSSTLRGDLDTIAIKALKKLPAERYATANAFGEDIERFLRGDVVLAQPDSVTYRALKFARRHWVGIGAASVLLLTLAVGLGATSYEAKIAAIQRDAAAMQRDAALQAQSRLLTEAAAQHLKDADVVGAQGIILEVLTNPRFAQVRTPAAISVFQETRAADAELAVLSGHGGSVRAVAYSPDGTRIVTASFDKSARIWDARTGAQLAVLSGHDDRVYCAAYSPDGTRIVTASQDKTARIWDARLGKQLAVLSGHGDLVRAAAYSPDGTRIVTASNDKTTRIWDARTGAQLAVLSGHSDIVESAAYSPDGTRIVTASLDKTARIWDARLGKQLAVFPGHDDRVYFAAYSPDGTRIVTASQDKTARIWDARSGKQLAVLSGHGNAVGFAEYSPDGARIVTTSQDKTTRIWDARTGAQLAVLSGHSDTVVSAAYSPDGTRIVTASLDKTARIWDARLEKQLAVLPGHDDRIFSAIYSPDGTRIVTASQDKTARIWDARLEKELVVLSGHDGGVNTAAYSPDGTRIVTASLDKTARIWDAGSGKQLAVLSGHGNRVYSAAYSPDGTRIVTASEDKTARIWDARLGKQLAVLSGHGDALGTAAYSPDGTRIVTASQDKTARIWDARLGKQLAVLSGHDNRVFSAAYSPDGSRIVTASDDKTTRIWDARTGVQLAVLSGHRDVVGTAAYSPDGTRIVTASNDQTTRIWDARTGAQLAVLSGHSDIVESAAYSPDGTRIVTASDDKTARIWESHVPATLDGQIAWDAAAQTDVLSDVDRTWLGLPADARASTRSTQGSACDQAAAAFYDSDRAALGPAQLAINVDIANLACAAEAAQPGHGVRLDYQWGRALWAKHDVTGARRQFELAVSREYPAARIDLGNLLLDGAAGPVDPQRAVSLYEKAWRDGVPIAAFALGHLYETGVPGAGVKFQTDVAQAWAWYQKGADAGEPTALARFGERDEQNALTVEDPSKAHALLLGAFRFYAVAAERAYDEGWPDEAWRHWRYRRATLARLLAREGMMGQVADAYTTVREQMISHRPTLWGEIKAEVHR
jgi:WD40 repeat protein/serine/threonine protein kinase/TPR repeat protein